eukprot:Hpha_TRINITY_DN15179_c0_g3::TRINITY_DN15179_c0_g3_i1::g.126675::m.126675/K14209/SLC36A, PAT; solute carrier family 36 (proton-coupled amino acid transporter)
MGGLDEGRDGMAKDDDSGDNEMVELVDHHGVHQAKVNYPPPPLIGELGGSQMTDQALLTPGPHPAASPARPPVAPLSGGGDEEGASANGGLHRSGSAAAELKRMLEHALGGGSEEGGSETSFPMFDEKQWIGASDEEESGESKEGGGEDHVSRASSAAHKHEYSAAQAAFHVFKANVGAAIFSLSAAYAYAGVVVGTAIILIGGVVCTHCMLLLVECKQKIDEKEVQTYGEVAARAFGKGGRRLVCIFLVVTQLGFCCVYFQFAGGMLGGVLPGGERLWMGLLVIPATALSFLPNMKRLVPAAIFATIVTVIALFTVYSYSIGNLTHEGIDVAVTSVTSPWLWPVAVGNTVSAFEGIGLVLPIENSMKNKEAFSGLLIKIFCFITALYVSFGLCGYLAFAALLNGGSSIIAVLPHEFAANGVRLCMALAILLTYPLQFFPAIQVIEGWIWPAHRRYQAAMNEGRKRGIAGCALFLQLKGNLALRAVISLLLATLAVAVGDRMGLFLSLIGGLGGAFMAVIFPPLLHLKLVAFAGPAARGYHDSGMSFRWLLTVFKDSCLVGCGLMCAMSSYFSVQELQRILSEPTEGK